MKPEIPAHSDSIIQTYLDESFTLYVTAEGTGKLMYKWFKNSMAIDSSDNDSRGGSSVASQTVTFGDTIALTGNPTRDSYRFLGWYKEETNENKWDFSIDTVYDNTTLYARWGLNHTLYAKWGLSISSSPLPSILREVPSLQ